MIKMEPFDCYREYVAIKTHFHADKYDYFKHIKLRNRAILKAIETIFKFNVVI